jgi:hypothetical protein
MAESVRESAEASSLNIVEKTSWDRTDFIPSHEGRNVLPFMVCVMTGHQLVR